jgi:Tfp pilus assembly protein PilV
MNDQRELRDNQTCIDKNLPDGTKLFVFLVGINSEWEEGRDIVGDKALFHALKETYRIPSHRMCFIKDRSATKRYVVKKLRSFLKRTSRHCTFLFYYGGHGNTDSFCTLEEELSHMELCQLVKDFFLGDMAWFVIDCCYSGNFYDSILQQFGNNHSCSKEKQSTSINHFISVCIMSTQKNHQAGGEWTLTECWISAIRHEDTMGKRKNWTAEKFLDYTADKTAEIKGDLLTFQVHPNDPCSIEKVCSSSYFFSEIQLETTPNNKTRDRIKSHWGYCKDLCRMMLGMCSLSTCQGSASSHLRDLKETALSQNNDNHSCWWFTKHELSTQTQSQQLFIGLDAFAKWKGGWTSSQTLPDSSRYILPLWFPCKILSWCSEDASSETNKEDGGQAFNAQPATNDRVRTNILRENCSSCAPCIKETHKVKVQFYDPQTSYHWNDITSCRNIRTKEWFCSRPSIDAIKPIVDCFTKAHYIMAMYGKYISYSLSPDTAIKVRYWDGLTYPATVLHWKYIPWENFTHDYWKSIVINGPYLPVSWCGENTYSLMPLSHVVLPLGD